MAVTKDSETAQEAQFTISNGDLGALNKIKESYQLGDGSDVIVFALGLLSQGAGRPVAIETQDGLTQKLLPADKLKRQDEVNAAEPAQ